MGIPIRNFSINVIACTVHQPETPCLCEKASANTEPSKTSYIFVVLQEETQEYLEEAKLKELVAKYSEFINFPIYLYASKEVDVPADEAADESEVSDEEADTADDGSVVDDGEFAFSHGH